MADSDDLVVPDEWPEIVRQIRVRTPARLLAGRCGAAYRTVTQLDLREAHAAARDAVRTELDLEQQFSPEFLRKWSVFEVIAQARSKEEYLQHPNLGRAFSDASRAELLKCCCPLNADFQVAIGDGLSVSAVVAQVPPLLPALAAGANDRGWTFGQTFIVRYCRVGILNQIGDLLTPKIAVLLIGERPGLATAESLSAYIAYRPKPRHTDADRNLISNIHSRGISPADAATRILDLAGHLMERARSGTKLQPEP